VITRRKLLGLTISTLFLKNLSVEEALAVGADILHGSRTKNHVALTFHGAGDIKTATDILAAERF
jgi:hypothetical protein